MRIEQAVRNGEWLELDWSYLAEYASTAISSSLSSVNMMEQQQPQAGSHPHLVRKWLLACSLFPEKWINRLFSVGGMRWHGEKLQLLAFPAVDPQIDKLYRKAIAANEIGRASVLYEDDYCLVMNKPIGMPVHEAYAGQMGTLDVVAAQHALEQNDPLPIRHIHRLDEDTSGPVLFAKNDLAQWRLDEAMRCKLIDRRYIAVVQGRVTKQAGTIHAPIGKDRRRSGKRCVTPGGDDAITHYEVVAANQQNSIVRVQLETGRTHQIRVHMSHIGHPLLGDALYGGSSAKMSHQALHGERLLFPHPLTGEIIEVKAPMPEWLEEHIRK